MEEMTARSLKFEPWLWKKILEAAKRHDRTPAAEVRHLLKEKFGALQEEDSARDHPVRKARSQ